MTAPLRPTTLEIDLDAAADNLRAVRGLVGPSRSIFAVVKADGYGFGAAEMGAVFARNGADWLAVADLAEGVRLRASGITIPILVYPNSLPEAA
ncbi:MAG TPA: alanine racemase, partial [Methylomirabilota bacterium]|nr:alanine racemase [Methylomirabilota bacterium]